MNRQQARDMQLQLEVNVQAKNARRIALKARQKDTQAKKQIQDLLKKGDTQTAYQKAKMLLSAQAHAQQADQMADMVAEAAMEIQHINNEKNMNQMLAMTSRALKRAQAHNSPEKTLLAVEQLNQLREENAMSSNINKEAFNKNTSLKAGDDAVHELLGKLADDAGIEFDQQLRQAAPSTVDPQASTEPTAEEEDKLQQRLRALRA
ncbi:Vacuolar-sorting protein SNF7 [Neonectria magnoliae]|uniref:Vacuolar-sorting protein SNF7 n=2 Tax=Neonectria TaxID=140106 RepID=A0ABR1HB17_9HYPO